MAFERFLCKINVLVSSRLMDGDKMRILRVLNDQIELIEPFMRSQLTRNLTPQQ
jgi:hypothetical protein